MNNSYKLNPLNDYTDKEMQYELKKDNEKKVQPYFEGANFRPCSLLRTIVKESLTDMNLYKLFTSRHLLI